jgi:Ca-activated chloride channel family protein
MSILLDRFVEWPWAVPLVVLLPLLGSLLLGAERRSRARRFAKLGTRQLLSRLAPLAVRLGGWRTVRLTAILALGGFALAGPRWGVGNASARSTGADVVLALDASLSMTAPDVVPSRLDAMKNVVRQLQMSSSGDRVALLAFAGHSYVLSPLTTDASAIALYLDNLDPQTVGVAGTSIASTIKQATTLLSERATDRQRVIIVMSDGEGFEPENTLVNEAKRARDAKITLITVGFGTPRGTTIPVRDSTGRITPKIGPDGRAVVTKYSPALLAAAAKAAQPRGSFVPAEARDKAERIRRVLNRLKSPNSIVVASSELSQQFQWFAIPAALLLLLDTFLALRSRRRKMLRAAQTTVAVASAATVIAACHRTPPRDKNAFDPARDTTYKAMYNRATRALPKDSLQRPILTLDSVTRGRDTAIRSDARFNAGWAYLVAGLRMNRGTPTFRGMPTVTRGAGPRTKEDSAFVDSAVVRYRAELRRNPNDEDARWNYELVMRQTAGGGNESGKGSQGKGKGKDQEQESQSSGPGKPKNVKPTPPRVERIKVEPQQAEALLDAAGQHERRAVKAIPTKPGVPPQGKDW